MNFQEIALPHFHALYNFARSIASTRQDAEDLVQETYLRAFNKFDQFGYGTNIKAWMFKILRNIAIDNHRNKDALSLADNELCSDEQFFLVAKESNVDTSIDLKNALNQLPEHYRVVVLLKDVEGFNYNEISDILSFPIGTVMSRLYRGRKQLFTLITGGKHKKSTSKLVMVKK